MKLCVKIETTDKISTKHEKNKPMNEEELKEQVKINDYIIKF